MREASRFNATPAARSPRPRSTAMMEYRRAVSDVTGYFAESSAA